MLLSPWPFFDEIQKQAVLDVLSSGKVNYWTGKEGSKFENAFADFCGTKHAIALANGSLALSAAYESLMIQPGEEVITTPRTFIATSSCLALRGAIPIFADVDSDSGNITAENIEPLINPKTKAIAVVHLGGWPADMPSICDLAKSYGISIVEDCSQAHGAQIIINGQSRSVGSFGDVATWSFCQDKIMSTGGEGGMITTENDYISDKIWSLKDHGKSRAIYQKSKNFTGFQWLHESFGSNYRLTEIQSAIGQLQLKELPKWNTQRNRNAMILIDAFAKLKVIRTPIPPENIIHAWYKFYAYINKEALASGWDRDRILFEIKKAGYPALTGSCSEIYLEKCFKDSGLSPTKRLKKSKELGETSLMFLIHPTIKIDQMKRYATTIKKILEKASI